MLHIYNHIKIPEEHMKILLKVFTMFKIRIFYYETTIANNGPCAVEKKGINGGKLLVVR